MYEALLVPTDGSAGAAAALPHAYDLAERYGATVHALYVVHANALGLTTPTDVGVEDLRSSLVAEGERATDEVVSGATARGLEAVSTVAVGIPHEAILEYVEDNDVDLVVMGTHGRTGLEHALLGSVTERVVRRAPVPVLTVHAREGE